MHFLHMDIIFALINNIYSSLPVHSSLMCFVIWMIIGIMTIFPIGKNFQEVKTMLNLLTTEYQVPNTQCDIGEALKHLVELISEQWSSLVLRGFNYKQCYLWLPLHILNLKSRQICDSYTYQIGWYWAE